MKKEKSFEDLLNEFLADKNIALLELSTMAIIRPGFEKNWAVTDFSFDSEKEFLTLKNALKNAANR